MLDFQVELVKRADAAVHLRRIRARGREFKIVNINLTTSADWDRNPPALRSALACCAFSFIPNYRHKACNWSRRLVCPPQLRIKPGLVRSDATIQNDWLLR